MHLYKKQRKATPIDKGGRQVHGPNVTWSLDERPGPRDRRVLPAPSWRDGGQVATSTPPRPGVAAPVLGHPAWSVSSLRRSPPGCAGSCHTAGTTVGGGERTGLPALSQRGCSVWGELLMLTQHVDALVARRGYRRSLSADARYGGNC